MERIFDLELYSYDSILAGIRAYDEIAVISVYPEGADRVRCVFQRCAAEPKLVVREFSNYILAMNVKRG